MTSHFSFFLEDIPAKYIGEMVESGLYGDDGDAVVMGLVMAGIREAITNRIIDRLDVGAEHPEAEDDERPAPPPDFSRCPDCGEPLEPGGGCKSLACMPF